MAQHRFVATAVVCLLLAVVSTAQQKRPITESDLLKFVWIGEPQVSPDGKQVAFVRVVVNEKINDYETSVWMVPIGEFSKVGPWPAVVREVKAVSRPLTSGTRDSAPRWSPDGTRLAFVRPSGGVPQIFVLPLSGGEAMPVTDLPRGAGAPAWSPDGKRIAFSSTTRPDDFEKKDPAAPRSDVRVITSATYRSNGGGWNDPERPSHLWVTDVTGAMAKATPLTSGKYSEAGQGWSADGTRVYFTSSRIDEPYYSQSKTELFAVPASGGNIVKVASIDGSIGAVKPSPDGKKLAFVGTLNGSPERSYNQPDLFVANADGSGTPKNLTERYDRDINGSVGGDQSAPRGGRAAGPIWASDGSSILVAAGDKGNANLVRVATSNGTVSSAFSGRHTVQSYSASATGDMVAAVVSSQTSVGDLFAIDTGTSVHDLTKSSPAQDHLAMRLTSFNDDLFNTLKLSEPETLTWKSFDGREIEGWLLKPPDFDPSKKYPFILEIHGGPHSAYGNVFTHEFQWLAARGYVVLFPNPRGSSNYGQEFGNVIQYRYPGDDYKDLMAGVDEVIKRDYIDRTKLGVTGGSGGGLLTNWTVTQTTRFAAAVSQRDIADWYGFWFTADFTLFTPSWFRKAPWEDPADFAARSPITHVAKVKTPMLFVLCDDDLRTPPGEGGEMMFRALKYLKVPTVMVRFPGETHELSRSGRPTHRLERLRHIVGWFDRWLLGKGDLYTSAVPGV